MTRWLRWVRIGPGALVVLLAGLTASAAAQDPSAGRSLFEAKCAACHRLGPERLVGPGLQGVTELRDRDWLVAFIRAPDRLVAAGDSVAQKLLAEYGVPMPNLGLTEDQARDLVAFLAASGGRAAEPAQPAVTGETDPATTGAAASGRRLFTGERALANGGAACISCHTVAGVGTLGGGTLARELTDAAARFGPGLTGLLENPPFPLMKVVYDERPLTPQEVADLRAFLEGVAESERPAASRSPSFPAFGLAAAVLLLGLVGMVWRGRLSGVREPLMGGRA